MNFWSGSVLINFLTLLLYIVLTLFENKVKNRCLYDANSFLELNKYSFINCVMKLLVYRSIFVQWMATSIKSFILYN